MSKAKSGTAEPSPNSMVVRMGKPSDVEECDPTPMEIPLGAKRPIPLNEMIARFIRDEVQRESAEEFETLEEADDFEPEDEDLLDLSPYEMTAMQAEYPIEEVPQEGDEAPAEADDAQNAPLDTPDAESENVAESDPPEASGETA